ncbi:hypothetical protein C8R43DRAFT_1201493 [Mycena crocata]|nr:hypothetical protein C8R43DRAFT_1201493 [Mycena crocata]
MSAHFQDVPTELVPNILNHLSQSDILSFSQVSHCAREIAEASLFETIALPGNHMLVSFVDALTEKKASKIRMLTIDWDTTFLGLPRYTFASASPRPRPVPLQLDAALASLLAAVAETLQVLCIMDPALAKAFPVDPVANYPPLDLPLLRAVACPAKWLDNIVATAQPLRALTLLVRNANSARELYHFSRSPVGSDLAILRLDGTLDLMMTCLAPFVENCRRLEEVMFCGSGDSLDVNAILRLLQPAKALLRFRYEDMYPQVLEDESLPDPTLLDSLSLVRCDLLGNIFGRSPAGCMATWQWLGSETYTCPDHPASSEDVDCNRPGFAFEAWRC